LLKNAGGIMTAKTAGQQVLATMGITPQGDLVAKPEYFGQRNMNTYTDPNTGKTYIGQEEILNDQNEDIPYNDYGDLETIANNYLLQPLSTTTKTGQLISGFPEIAPLTPSQIIEQQFGAIPPMYVDPGLLGGAPGLPAFVVVPEPVYTDQDVLQVIANRYYDRPELVQFLQTQIPDIAQRFRLSQTPGALDQESFLSDPTGATLQVPDPYQVMQDAPVIDEETGYQRRDAQGNLITESVPTYTVTPPTTFTGEFGEAIDDYTGSSAAYSYFERDRPKTIADFISNEAAQYESAFAQSPLFIQEQERLERERQVRDAQQRQQFVSQPVSIFGRRQR